MSRSIRVATGLHRPPGLGYQMAPQPVGNAALTTVVRHMESTFDAEMPEQVIWPAQVVCGGLTWTQKFS